MNSQLRAQGCSLYHRWEERGPQIGDAVRKFHTAAAICGKSGIIRICHVAGHAIQDHRPYGAWKLRCTNHSPQRYRSWGHLIKVNSFLTLSFQTVRMMFYFRICKVERLKVRILVSHCERCAAPSNPQFALAAHGPRRCPVLPRPSSLEVRHLQARESFERTGSRTADFHKYSWPSVTRGAAYLGGFRLVHNAFPHWCDQKHTISPRNLCANLVV